MNKKPPERICKSVMMNRDDWERYATAAKARGVSLAQWFRDACDAAYDAQADAPPVPFTLEKRKR